MERRFVILKAASLSPDPKRIDYIDSLRGLAIAGVIATHSLILFPDLPWLVRQLGGLGSHGVHLFFVASALTLMVSWSSRRDGVLSFYTRRAFRIVPMFYLATMLYMLLGSVLESPFWADGTIDFRAILLTLLFSNGWFPAAINAVVPGGWTISVEMTFYVIFPLLATLITTPLRAAIFVVLALLIAATANMSIPVLYPGSEASALKFFSYYWLPNSLPSFAVGFLAYSLLNRAPRGRWAASCLLLCAGLAAAFVMLGPLPYSS
jgi:peptidoglycan/LPS O-acetylase OafA/YrhL